MMRLIKTLLLGLPLMILLLCITLFSLPLFLFARHLGCSKEWMAMADAIGKASAAKLRQKVG